MTKSITILLVTLFFSSLLLAGTPDNSGIHDKVLTLVKWSSAKAAYSELEQFNGFWRGVGDGKWGVSNAEKYFTTILDGNVICRGGNSIYPIQDRNPKGEQHKSYSLIALIKGGKELMLTEYDNEGFIARYTMNLSTSEENKNWIFEYVSGENFPSNFRARLTIEVPQNNSYIETLELDFNFNGKGYDKYITNRLTRVSNISTSSNCQIE